MTSTQDTPIKHGEFTALADDYAKYRPDYSKSVLRALRAYVGASRPNFQAVDVGAGTGIWTRILAESGLSCRAVEPNDAMRAQGGTGSKGLAITWSRGSAETTGLDDQSADWLTMASSFHWADPARALPEFHRVLRPQGFVTVLWNPREVDANPLQQEIEAMIYKLVPELKRVSSGGAKHSPDYGPVLISTGHFENPIFMEARHQIVMSQERYLGAWRSVNDIQKQAGPTRFADIMDEIQRRIASLGEIIVHYKTRAWTAQRRDH